jgi:hypothetical protein
MKIQSAKQKGRRGALEVKELLYKYAPDLKPGDIEVTSSSVTGEDLKLSPAARQIYPLVIECKNTESINVWAAFEQAKSHLKKYNEETQFIVPVLFFKRNRSELMACLRADDFIKLTR